jgi:hypothetical protein
MPETYLLRGVVKMKVKCMLAVFLVLAISLSPAPVFAASDWDTFTAEMEKRSKIKDTGAAVIADMLDIAPQGTEAELWNKLWDGEPRWRAAAAVSLINRVFPQGDPSRWQEVSGFVPQRSVQPRQLLAMDALFVAVDSLRQIPDGVWGSAYLLYLFGKSGMGKVMFIEEIPEGMDKVLNDVISVTGLPGDWSIKKIRGRLPVLPIYRGYITRDTADSRNMQYLDGYGSIASNGRYAWDRDRGYVYEVIEDRYERDIWINP